MPVVYTGVHTKLDTDILRSGTEIEAYYIEDIPPYLQEQFPMYGTIALGNSTTNSLYLSRDTVAYLVRYL